MRSALGAYRCGSGPQVLVWWELDRGVTVDVHGALELPGRQVRGGGEGVGLSFSTPLGC